MWYFLLSDAFTFSAFLITYGALRVSNKWWPDPNHVFNAMPFMGHKQIPLGFVSIMTFILILSSVFVVLAVIEGHRMNKKGVLLWMLGGIAGGAAFLGCQAWEWSHLISEGLRPFFNPFVPDAQGMTHLAKSIVDPETGRRVLEMTGNMVTDAHGHKFQLGEGFGKFGGVGAFGALFFGITGFHGFHVFTGVLLNVWGFFATLSGKFEKVGHYEMIEKLGLYWHFVDLVWVFVFLAFYLL
ncbi:MAG: cytochrome c oxidase subunit 3 [Chitinophagales bacterium]|nr:cytochrome c oxidase subunit 3 [Chitinophagales bacterium]